MTKKKDLVKEAEKMLEEYPEEIKERSMKIIKDLQSLRDKQVDEVAELFIGNKAYLMGEEHLGMFIRDYCTLVMEESFHKVMEHADIEIQLANNPNLSGN